MIEANSYFFGPVLFRLKLENADLENIKKLCIRSEQNNYADALAGAFKTEYLIDKGAYSNIMNPYMEYFRQGCNEFYGKKIKNLIVASAWVNYMKKGDFNPSHVHLGCRFSTVMVLQSPKDLKKEIQEYYNYSNCNDNGPGCLAFRHGESLPELKNIKTFEPEEGYCFFFPSWLEHWVNPFKCDGERITVASNINYME
jgi:uncharacterized protein (TIGR02466 family)